VGTHAGDVAHGDLAVVVAFGGADVDVADVVLVEERGLLIRLAGVDSFDVAESLAVDRLVAVLGLVVPAEHGQDAGLMLAGAPDPSPSGDTSCSRRAFR